MTKQQMLDVIYEKVADKTLRFGCKIIAQYSSFSKKLIIVRYYGKLPNGNDYGYGFHLEKNGDMSDEIKFMKISKIIGSDVMIGDVLDYLIKSELFKNKHNERLFKILNQIIIEKWLNLREKIDNQSLECIEYIYQLVKD